MAKHSVGHAAHPPIAVLACGACGAEIEIEVPIIVEYEDGNLTFTVDNDAISVQPMWDHNLFAHGPHLD